MRYSRWCGSLLAASAAAALATGCGHRDQTAAPASSAPGGPAKAAVTPASALNDPNTPQSVKDFIRRNVPPSARGAK